MNKYTSAPLACLMLILTAVILSATAASVARGEHFDDADSPGDPRGAAVEEVRNDRPAFMVRVDVDHTDRTYQGGEQLRVRVRSAREGYLYLIYCDAGKNVSCLFPNAIQKDNRIPAYQDVVIPPPAAVGRRTFQITMGKPYGSEVLKAIVTTYPLENAALAQVMKSLQRADGRVARGAIVEEAKSLQWAEHNVQIETRPPANRAGGGAAANRIGGRPAGAAPVVRPPRRVGVFIGISQFADERIRDLNVSDDDAKTLADAMRKTGGVDDAWVMTDERATRKNIEYVLRRAVPDATRPGDTVVIYWSGHGSRCADDSGDEKDGLDEYLVPYDGRLDDIETIRKTMILDDSFGRWLQDLDGRRILVVLDTCHSGGQGGEKSIGDPAAEEDGEFDFLDGEIARMKDIGQRETALLASSTARQVSFERKEGDLSAMTYFLVRRLQQGQGPLELKDAYDAVSANVAEYVEKTFPGTTQTPVLMNNLSGPLYLRPRRN